ncbi:hypothetical protein [Paraburkholderia sp. MM6662-R1]|uniref:hypothetical protein n=1 Tax=Paraburkholderia sp. MM6662-R1 TaxID=2991066 RepID=UPI003D201E28
MRPSALLLDDDTSQSGTLLTRQPLDAGHSEKWLQDIVFRHPEILPLNEISGSVHGFVPICSELLVPKEGRNIRLDIFGVTPHGKVVLIECKLWRNPEARREVVGQILEYAALLRTWTYADLEAKLKAHSDHRSDRRWQAVNPLYQIVKSKFPDVEEARFVDNVSHSLHTGNFVMAIVGDGIRRDIQAMKELLEKRGGLLAQLGLIEMQVWKDADGRTLLVPSLAIRTDVIQHRVVVDGSGTPLVPAESSETDKVEPESIEEVVKPDRDSEFWNLFMAQIHFDHPEQPMPKLGPHPTNARVELPAPARWITLYRPLKGEMQLFFRLYGEDGADCFERLKEEQEDIRRETGLDVEFRLAKSNLNRSDAEKPLVTVTRSANIEPALTVQQQVAWFAKATNAMVNAFRPRLMQFARERMTS